MIGAIEVSPVSLAIDEFDLHVHLCSFCLVRGNRLCNEGRFIAEDVATLRAAIKRPMRGPHRGFDLLRRSANLRQAVA